MIYTFTPNPAIDYYVDVKDFELNKINRVEDSYFIVAGKGINCSALLGILNIENSAIYFYAGFTGRYITERLNKKKYINTFPIETKGTTRVNVKFIGENDTAINANGTFVTDKAKKELDQLIDNLNEDDYFIISGSLLNSFNKEDIVYLAKRINNKKTKLILDIPNLKLEDIKDIEIFMLKPNIDEFSYFLGKQITIDNYKENVNKKLNNNIKNILLSLGKDGSYYAGEYGNYSIKIPNIKAYSTVGAGDCTLAGFVGAIYLGNDIKEALRLANACGCAKVKYGMIEHKERIYDLLDLVEVINEKQI